MKIRTDAQLRHAVELELTWDSRTLVEDIKVSVDQGIVTLRGTVSSYAQKLAAQELAHCVSGVMDVANDLEVQAKHALTDTETARAVRQALEWDAMGPDEQITSTVSNGWVTLEGTVDSMAQRTDAETAITNLVGVTGVLNRLRVIPLPITSDELRRSIEAALERRADREADRFRIDISDGEVTLFGRVHSWPERKAVVGSVSHAPGVRQVHDNLRVDPCF